MAEVWQPNKVLALYCLLLSYHNLANRICVRGGLCYSEQFLLGSVPSWASLGSDWRAARSIDNPFACGSCANRAKKLPEVSVCYARSTVTYRSSNSTIWCASGRWNTSTCPSKREFYSSFLYMILLEMRPAFVNEPKLPLTVLVASSSSPRSATSSQCVNCFRVLLISKLP